MPKDLRTASASRDGIVSVEHDACPLVGGEQRVSILMVVDLPAPLGPRKANISPCLTLERNIIDRGKVPEFFREIFYFDNIFCHEVLIIAQRPFLLVPQRFDRVKRRGAAGRVLAEDDADGRRDAEGEQIAATRRSW